MEECKNNIVTLNNNHRGVQKHTLVIDYGGVQK